MKCKNKEGQTETHKQGGKKETHKQNSNFGRMDTQTDRGEYRGGAQLTRGGGEMRKGGLGN